MRYLYRIVVLFVIFVTGCAPAFAEENSSPTLTKDIKILFTSDVHCAIDQGWGYGGVYAIKQGFSQDCHVLLVDNGDAIQGESIGLITRGSAIIDLMNTCGYDIAIPGNHEFDYGMENFLKLTEKADFPYISCNFNHEGNLVFPAYLIKEFDGVKIAFIGVTTPMTIRDSAPKYFMDDDGNYIYDFSQDETGEELCRAVQKSVDDARKEGADYVVVMGHLGNEAEVSPWRYSDVISRTTGIDAFLDGHSHDTDQVIMKNKDGHPVYRQACGTKNAFIGVLTIGVDGTISTELLPWTASISAPKLLGLSNPAVAKVKAVNAEMDKIMDSVIAGTSSDLVIYDPKASMSDGEPVRIIRNAETNLGDLCADAYLNHFSEADIALVNASGIRAEIKKGGITLNDILAVLPYGTKLDLVEVTGQQLLDALEWSVHAIPEEFSGFEQVAGLKFEVDPDIESPCVEDKEKMFVRVDDTKPRRVQNVEIRGASVDPAAKYKLVTNDFILLDGDGFTMFRDAEVLKEAEVTDGEALLEYIAGLEKGIIGEEYADPYGQGRIISR